jgi:exopolyphosphatase / guanosine-5'-triphosphate,3'-diphosphate pyrophosphatase
MGAVRAARPVAVIDIGTNSIKLLVGAASGRRVKPVLFRRVTTRLGAGLSASGRIEATAAARTTRAVRALAAEARRSGAARVVAVGTCAFRSARNGPSVADGIARAAGIEVRVLSGREEARLAFLSARTHIAHPRAATLLVDIGGGSAQFVAARGERIVASHSLPLGALQLTERYLRSDPIDPEEYARMLAVIDHAAGRVVLRAGDLRRHAALVAVGGSATTALTMARCRRERAESGVLKLSDLRRIEAACLARTAAARRRLPGLPPDRADIIPAGIAVVIAFMRAAGKRVVHVSGGGVREGVILTLWASG